MEYCDQSVAKKGKLGRMDWLEWYRCSKTFDELQNYSRWRQANSVTEVDLQKTPEGFHQKANK
jgi:hypothetical protein